MVMYTCYRKLTVVKNMALFAFVLCMLLLVPRLNCTSTQTISTKLCMSVPLSYKWMLPAVLLKPKLDGVSFWLVNSRSTNFAAHTSLSPLLSEKVAYQTIIAWMLNVIVPVYLEKFWISTWSQWHLSTMYWPCPLSLFHPFPSLSLSLLPPPFLSPPPSLFLISGGCLLVLEWDYIQQ